VARRQHGCANIRTTKDDLLLVAGGLISPTGIALEATSSVEMLSLASLVNENVTSRVKKARWKELPPLGQARFANPSLGI